MTSETNNSADLVEPRGPDDSRIAPLLIGFFLLIALAIGLDVVTDWTAGTSLSHVGVELVVVGIALTGVVLLSRALVRARSRVRVLTSQLASTAEEAKRWRDQWRDLLKGLAEAIDQQLDAWGLSSAEKEVAFLLLKGLSHAEVAGVRGTTERTARKQALAVYRKAGLSGRAELAAFFLEDLLSPPTRGGSGAPTGT